MPKLIPKRIREDFSSDPLPLRKPRILAPAGDWECVHAAVENGADAVYFGLNRFNARMRAANFTLNDLPDLMAFLHRRGVQGYLTFNTLLFTDEVAEADTFLKAIIRAGVDAAIVQDPAVCLLIRRLSPDFAIHASTQMSITSEAGIRFASTLGASLTVMARECSLSELATINRTIQGNPAGTPMEIFVHGALCVAYSGQCLTSEALGGRSANRGECAQACRLPFELIADGKPVPLGKRRYLLSPQDLAGIDLLPDIIRAGIACLKIEGRLKSPEYVAAITSVYRRQLDKVWDALQIGQKPVPIHPEDNYTLEMTFSRGLYTGWLNGIDNRHLVHAQFGKKRGVYLGTVTGANRSGVYIRAQAPLQPGDGLVFDSGNPEIPEEGGRVISVDKKAQDLFVRFHGDSVNTDRLIHGQDVWKTSDPVLERKLRKSWQVARPTSTTGITAILSGAPGTQLRLTLRDPIGNAGQAFSSAIIETATRHSVDPGILQRQIGRLGDTPFHLEHLENQVDPHSMVPISLLNQLRREASQALIASRENPELWTLHPDPLPLASLYPSRNPDTSQAKGPSPSRPFFIPYVRDMAQLEAVAQGEFPEIYIELENPSHYRDAVARFREITASDKNRTLWVAPPRIFKTGEDWIIRKLTECGADGFLARNHEHLNSLRTFRLRADFSFNIANPITASWFLQNGNLERLTLSYDLNQQQARDLLTQTPRGTFEITLHQHMPMFHMEHCLYCAFLTTGKDFHDCGRPCDTRRVSIRDRVGMDHPLKADAGCRNTVFNARAQTGADYLHAFIEAGARAFRIEFLNETPAEVIQTLDRYEQLLHRRIDPASIWRELKLINQLGVTRGTLKA